MRSLPLSRVLASTPLAPIRGSVKSPGGGVALTRSLLSVNRLRGHLPSDEARGLKREARNKSKATRTREACTVDIAITRHYPPHAAGPSRRRRVPPACELHFPETSMATSPSPVKRLTTYWKIEAGNAVFIPALAVYLVLKSGGRISTALVLSGLACSFLLVIGTIVLRMMLRKARGEADAIADRIPLLARMRWPAIALCVAAAVANGTEWLRGGLELSAQCLAPAVLLLLAVLEYVNYYHFQLQHFDHAPDWQRLIAGRGFRRSHLAREIERWKRETRPDA